MAKFGRKHKQGSSTYPQKAVPLEAEQALLNSDQTNEVEPDSQIEPISTDLASNQAYETGSNNIFILNTNDINPIEPNLSLISGRKELLLASMGKESELVSIIVQAYNRLGKTKTCIECILKYTTDIEYELILLDNGSTDGTFEYFKSVKHPRKKILRITKNIGHYAPTVNHYLSGRYLAFVCNDVFVTKNWLTNLLICLKSEDAIGMVVPTISNAFDLQGADVKYKTFNQMQAEAAKYNISDPRRWHERLTLIPVVTVFKREAVDVTGMVDYGFHHDFSDYDHAFRFRRAGYKTVLCKDTFVDHNHFRVNFTKEEIAEIERSTEAGREDFKKKHFGVDAWDDVNNYEPGMISLVNSKEHKDESEIELLGVDVFCGTPILELKNKLREAHCYNTRLSAFATDPKHWIDLKTICAGDVIVDRIENLNQYFADERFDYVILGKHVNVYRNHLELLQNLHRRLKPNGHLLIKFRNTNDIVSLFNTLGARIDITGNTKREKNLIVFQLSVKELLAQLKNAGFNLTKVAVENWPLRDHDLQILKQIIANTSFSAKPGEVFEQALIRNFVIDIPAK